MTDLLKKLIKQGAYLKTAVDSYWLLYAGFEKSSQRLECLYMDQQEQRLHHQTWTILNWSMDEDTGKLYLAYSDTEYIQVKPAAFNQLPVHRRALEQSYLTLTNEVLPGLALRENWPVKDNHCFQRIILDDLFQDAWYRVLPEGKRSVYRRLDNYQLGRATLTAYRIRHTDSSMVEQLQRQSLVFRNKAR